MASSLVSVTLNSLLGDSPLFSVTDERLKFSTWKTLKIKSVEVDSQAANTSNPIADQDSAENSTTNALTENDIKTLKIIQPTRMRITAFANSISAIESVINSFTDLKSTLTITSKGIRAVGMCVTSIDLMQDPSSLSATRIIIELEQTALPTLSSLFAAAQGADASVISSYGVSLPPVPVTNLTSNVTALYNKVSNFFRG